MANATGTMTGTISGSGGISALSFTGTVNSCPVYCLFVSFLVYFFVCFFVSKITIKRLDRFA